MEKQLFSWTSSLLVFFLSCVLAGCSQNAGSGSTSFNPPASGGSDPNAAASPQAVPPGFSPASPYKGPATKVSISDQTSGASLQYCSSTTGTCNPDTSYTGSVAVAVSEYLCASATARGFMASKIACWQGTITPSQVAAPTFIPPSPYTGDVTRVTIADEVAGAAILYCIDSAYAQSPCVPSLPWTGQINVTASESIRANAISGSLQPSPTVTWQGTIRSHDGLSYADRFQSADGPLGPNWSPAAGSDCTPVIRDGWVMASSAPCNHSVAVYIGGQFNNNQWSSALVGAATTNPIGYQTLLLRSSGPSTYDDAYSGYTTSWSLGVLNPAPFDFAGGTANVAPKAGDRIELDAAGTGPVFFWSKLNGRINNGGIDTRFNYIGGYPGLGLVEQNAVPTAQAADWKGGSLPPFSAVPRDDFQRADDGWLGVDWWFPWQGDEGGGWVLSGNTAVPAPLTLGSWDMAVWTSPLGPNPFSRIAIGSAGTWLGVFTRYTPVNSTHDSFYAALVNAGKINLYARVNGQWNLMTSWPYRPTPGDTLELDAAGTNPVTLTVLVNGAAAGTWSDLTYNLSGQYAGFAALGNPSTVTAWAGGTL